MKTRILAFALFLFSCASRPTVHTPIYRVDSVDGFIDAIGPDRVIEFEAGVYVLSGAFGESLNNPFASVVTEYADPELHIRGVRNLILRGSTRGETTLITSPSYGNVLVFGSSSRITLENLVIGHGPDPGFCTGGVLKFLYCGEVTVNNCYLFGSGIEGINAERVNMLRVAQTTIADCSYNILSLSECADALFQDCRFTANTSEIGGFINLHASSGVRFVNCRIDHNRSGSTAYLFETSQMRSTVRIDRCLLTDNEVIDWCNDSSAVIVSNSFIRNNRLPEEDHFHVE